MQMMKNTKTTHNFLLTLLVFFLSGCSGASLLNVIVPHSGYTLYKNIAYGALARQNLDIYVPDEVNSHTATILFSYGGSWEFGSKDQYRFVGQALASKGFITVIADYRLYPQAYFPDFVQDTAKALVWVRNHIRSYGGNPHTIFLMGHSAGAFNVMMLTVNKSYLQQEGGESSWIKGTIGIAGPYDFLPFTDPEIKTIFSKVNDADTQPIHFVTPGLPPILLITGAKDTDVYPKNSINLYHKLQQNNDPAELIVYPDRGHIGIIVSMVYGFRWMSPLLNDITHFVQHRASGR